MAYKSRGNWQVRVSICKKCKKLKKFCKYGKYEAKLSCTCGWSRDLSDEEYIRALKAGTMPELGCGHFKYATGKISAKHKVDTTGWRMGFGHGK